MAMGILSRLLAMRGMSIINTGQLKRQLSEIERLQREIDRLSGVPGASSRVAAAGSSVDSADPLVDDIARIIFRGLPSSARNDIQFFDRLYKYHGPLRSTAGFSSQSKLDAELHFHFREKAEVALTACSSWYGGDYFEFGSGDLNTFRNMLTAYDICGMTQAYKDVRFYAFDIFGDLSVGSRELDKASTDGLEEYFAPYVQAGDQLKVHKEYLAQHNLFVDKCFLVQGLFQHTLTDEFKRKYKAENRKIGFAFLDCNIGASYKTVFEYIFDIMGKSSYIYMDEYLQSPGVADYFEQFQQELRRQRNMGCLYIRNAGGFGGMFRLYPLDTMEDAERDLTLVADDTATAA